MYYYVIFRLHCLHCRAGLFNVCVCSIVLGGHFNGITVTFVMYTLFVLGSSLTGIQVSHTFVAQTMENRFGQIKNDVIFRDFILRFLI